MLKSLPSDQSRAKMVDYLFKNNFGLGGPFMYTHRLAGKISLLKLYIKHGANIHARDEYGYTLLHHVASDPSDARELLNSLTKAGADVNAQRNQFPRHTPLHLAVGGENESTVAFLLALPDTKTNIKDNEGLLPLHLACKRNSSRIVRMLLNAMSQHTDLPGNSKTEFSQQSPLHVAVQGKRLQVVTEILDHEIFSRANYMRIEDQDRNGNTALHYASRDGQYEICVQLLKHGAVRCLDVKNNDGMSPLHLAAQGGHHDICVLLLKYQSIQNENDVSPLRLAARGGYRDICALLLGYQSKPCIDEVTLSNACASGNVEIVRWFMDNYTIDLKVRNENDRESESDDARDEDGNASVEKLLSGRQTKPNFLFRATQLGRQQVAKFIVQDSPLWHNGLCNYVINGGILDTPMRALIRTMPDVARQALNRCTDITDSGVRFNYEFVDDHYSVLEPERDEWNGSEQAKCNKSLFHRRFRNQSPYTSNARVLQDNHVLSLMVKYDRDDLLKHPLVSTLIGQKWRKYGRQVFLASFIGYLSYLTLLTAYSASIAPINRLNSMFYLNQTFYPFWTADACADSSVPWPLNPDVSKLNQADVCRVIEEYRKPPYNCSTSFLEGNGFTHFARLTLLSSSIFILIAKLALLFTMHDFDDFLACCVYASTIVVTLPWNGFDCFYEFGLMQSWAWQVASINILLAYVHLALKLEFAPGLGIYVHMLRNVSTTMLRVLVVPFGIILSALALCFHMIFKASVRYDHKVKVLPNDTHDQPADRPLNPFSTFPHAIMKTLVMFIGEYDLETHFMTNDVEIAPVVLILLAVFGTIAVMNLLFGLAINDVNTLHDHAEAQQLKMQIRYALSVERLIRLKERVALMTKLCIRPSYIDDPTRSDYISYYSWDGVLLQEYGHFVEVLTPDQDYDWTRNSSVRSKTGQFWGWFYYKIIVGQRYTTNFRARLQEISVEKNKLAEDLSQVTEKTTRAKRMAPDEERRGEKVPEETRRARGEDGASLASSSDRVKAMHRARPQETVQHSVKLAHKVARKKTRPNNDGEESSPSPQGLSKSSSITETVKQIVDEALVRIESASEEAAQPSEQKSATDETRKSSQHLRAMISLQTEVLRMMRDELQNKLLRQE